MGALICPGLLRAATTFWAELGQSFFRFIVGICGLDYRMFQKASGSGLDLKVKFISKLFDICGARGEFRHLNRGFFLIIPTMTVSRSGR